MNCKICGAELKRPGDVCNNCMNKIKLENKVKADKKEVYSIKRKFSIGYEILMKIESIGVAVFVIAILISLGGEYARYGYISIPFFIIWGLIYILYRYFKFKTTSYVFYKTKLVYSYRKIRKKKTIINYEDIKEISYQQPGVGRIFNVGNILITTNSMNLVKRTIFIDAVENVEKTFSDIKP